MTSLLLIEGLPGTGKSSLARLLSAELSKRQLPHQLILEADEANPFRFKSGTSAETSALEFLAAVPKQWREFVDLVRGSDTTIVQEGMTFQQQVNYLTWINRQEKIPIIIEDIFKTIASLSCRLIYLRNRNPQQAMNEIMDVRGSSWVAEKVHPIVDSPYAKYRELNFQAALSSFTEDLQLTTDRLFRAAPVAKAEIDVTNKEWDNVFKRALSFALNE